MNAVDNLTNAALDAIAVDHDARTEHGIVVRRASTIEPKGVDWIWPGRFARAKHCAIAGEPATNKSTFANYVAATITTGREWPCGEGRSPLGSVIILSAEDGADDTIVPRLIAAGADLSRVHIVEAVKADDGKGTRSFNLQGDIARLETLIQQIGDVLLVIIDPVSSYMGRADSHKNSEVRGVLEPLQKMAERTGVAVLSITHFSKAGGGTAPKALHRFIGSIAFTAAARMGFAVIEDAEDNERRLLLHVKNNLAAPPQGLAFRVKQTIIENNIVASRIEWESAPVTMTANDALAAEAETGDRSSTDDCAEFLRATLADGPLQVKPDIEQQARDAGLLGDGQSISQSKPFRKARDRLGIVVSKDGFQGKWVWNLPKVPSDPKGAPLNIVAPLTHEGTFEARCAQCAKSGGTDNPLLTVAEPTGDVRLHRDCLDAWQAMEIPPALERRTGNGRTA